MTDDELVALAKGGDMNAFEKIVKTYEKRVYNIALRMSGNEHDAFDLSQEAFLRVYRTLSSFKGRSSFSTWLFRITSNICIDFARKQARKNKKEQPIYIRADDGGEALLEIPDLRYNPEEISEKRRMREALQSALERLSPEHRQIIALRESGGLSYAEIAAALSLGEGTVKSRLARARESLREALVSGGNFHQGFSSKQTEDALGADSQRKTGDGSKGV